MAKDWRDLIKTTKFHIPENEEAPYDPVQIAVHKRVLRVGMIFAAVGLIPAMIYAIGAVYSAVVDVGRAVQYLLVGIPMAIAIPVLFYFYGTSIALLFTPTAFLQGPIGKKWLKVAGVKSPGMARLLCLLLFLFSTAIIIAVVVLLWLDSK